MSEENDKKFYVHLKGLIAGNVKTGNPVRDELIVSDATLNLADLIKKRPNIDFEEAKVKEEVKVTQSPEKVIPKSKEKK